MCFVVRELPPVHFRPLSQDCVRRGCVMNQLGGQNLFKALSGVSWATFSLDVISGPAVEHWERNKRKTKKNTPIFLDY